MKKLFDSDVMTIEKIHNEFNIAGNVLLTEALMLINASKSINDSKLNRLKDIGFELSKDIKEAQRIINNKAISEKLALTIEYYKNKYPLYKYITLEKIKEICKKYGLIYASVKRYTGFVPEKNLNEIEKFNIHIEDIKFTGQRRIINTVENIIAECKTLNLSEDQTYIKILSAGYIDNNEFIIAAPSSQFNISDREEIKDYTIVKKVVPDPVVFKEVKDGYLIVTAWGKESEDPIIKNEINN
jgi:hypothetical protein